MNNIVCSKTLMVCSWYTILCFHANFPATLSHTVACIPYSSNWTRKRTNSGLSTGESCTPFLEFDSLETWSGSDYQLPPPCPVNKIRWYSMFLWIKIALFLEVPRKGMILCISLLQPSVKHKIWNMNKFANLLTFNTGPLINICSAGSIQWLY